MLTAQEIRSTAFQLVKRGYNVEDVDSFLRKVAGEFEALQSECAAMLQEKDKTIEAMEAEKADTERKMLILADKLEEYRAQETLLQNALLNAEKMKESLLGEARQTGEILLRDAQQKADKILENANRKVATEQQTYLRMQQEVAKFKSQVLDIYKTHLAVISALPEESDGMMDLSAPVTVEEETKPAAETKTTAETAAEPVTDTTADPVEPVVETIEMEAAAEQESAAKSAETPAMEDTAPSEQPAEARSEQYDGFAPRSMVKEQEQESSSRFGALDKFSFGK